ncbi:unnamed protein product [Oppiella nova]|uniref:OmpR-like protein n=1 Tax=Oppiella nova TaxID=334625 RepID=A0A7R9LZG4_9ACAR|nr:unnamed protein product [Oppiella nova]CAG2168434.1 unnamed protein product [Oppiella nova]
MQDSKPHILVVDDDHPLSTKEAKSLLQYFIYDLIILDVMLPGINGIDFVKTIKSNKSETPIVMLTALSEIDDRIRGLESGASDYITKPFEPRELLIRIRNLINNYNNYKKEQKIKRLGNSYYNLESKEFKKKDKVILLSSTEQKLLEILISSNGQTISRDELSTLMGNYSIRSIDVQIVRIRSKIEDDTKEPKYLKTIRNEGYALYT